jgi:hypothetical protein
MMRASEAHILPRFRSCGREVTWLESSNHGAVGLALMLLAAALAAIVLFSLAGCEKLSGEGVVLAKEHIAAAPQNAATPSAEPTSVSNEQLRPIGQDEITVDGYVMKPEARGTSRDPRALQDEQWLVKVRMIDDGRTFNLQTEQAQFDKLKESDRVKVRYRLGKYTKTVWAAEIVGIKK